MRILVTLLLITLAFSAISQSEICGEIEYLIAEGKSDKQQYQQLLALWNKKYLRAGPELDQLFEILSP